MTPAADAHLTLYDKAFGSVDGPVTVTARKALAPATTPPAAGEEGTRHSAA